MKRFLYRLALRGVGRVPRSWLLVQLGRAYLDQHGVNSEPGLDYCRSLIDRYNGENNSDPQTNGEWRFLQAHVPRCRVILDVGANRGDWTRAVLAANPRAVVHCFEPCRATYSQLLASNFPPNVVCNRFGLSSEAGTMELNTFDEDCGMNSLYRREGIALIPSPSTESVSLRTLDDYCLEQGIDEIDFMKIDVEGHEVAVMRGAREMIARRAIARLQFEYGGSYIDARVLLKDAFELFRGSGYAVHRILPDGLLRCAAYDSRLENFQYKNFAVLRSDVAADM